MSGFLGDKNPKLDFSVFLHFSQPPIQILDGVHHGISLSHLQLGIHQVLIYTVLSIKISFLWNDFYNIEIAEGPAANHSRAFHQKYSEEERT